MVGLDDIVLLTNNYVHFWSFRIVEVKQLIHHVKTSPFMGAHVCTHPRRRLTPFRWYRVAIISEDTNISFHFIGHSAGAWAFKLSRGRPSASFSLAFFIARPLCIIRSDEPSYISKICPNGRAKTRTRLRASRHISTLPRSRSGPFRSSCWPFLSLPWASTLLFSFWLVYRPVGITEPMTNNYELGPNGHQRRPG